MADDLLEEFFSDLKEVDRDNEVNRILWAFKLNPFEKLNLRFDTTVEDVKRQYRKLSLAVHPDKCKHPQANEAFEVLAQAQKELLDDEKRELLLKALDVSREEIRKERKKQTKHDSAVRLASILNEGGREAIESAWEQTDEFHEKWKMKSRELLANAEWRKRRLNKRVKEEELRIEAEESETREKIQKTREKHKDWETNRESRVGTWRDFMKQGSSKGKAVGVLKPPKMKTNDEDRLYVQRPIGEQFRPPPPKPKP